MTASLGPTALFVHFDAERNTLSISDLSNSTVLEGSYEDLKVTLNDSYDLQTFNFTMHVLPPPTNSTEEIAESSPNSTNTKQDDRKTTDSEF